MQTSKSLEVFDGRTNEWSRVKDLDIGSINYSVVCLGDVLWAIGGTSAGNNLSKLVNWISPKFCYILKKKSKCYFLQVITINLVTGRVSRIESLNNHRQQCAAVIVEQGTSTFVYAIGGITDEDTLESVER